MAWFIMDAAAAGDQEALAVFEEIERRATEDVGKLRRLMVERLR